VPRQDDRNICRITGRSLTPERSGTSATERKITIHSAPENLSAERLAKELEAHCSGAVERPVLVVQTSRTVELEWAWKSIQTSA
jgi:hypothetical protein